MTVLIKTARIWQYPDHDGPNQNASRLPCPIDPFHVSENVAKLEEKRKEI